MPRRKVHAPDIVDDAALQCFGKIDEENIPPVGPLGPAHA
jgi:hypothetical protein